MQNGGKMQLQQILYILRGLRINENYDVGMRTSGTEALLKNHEFLDLEPELARGRAPLE